MPTTTASGVGKTSALTAATKAPTRIIPSTPIPTIPARSERTAPSDANTSGGAYARVEKRKASRNSRTLHPEQLEPRPPRRHAEERQALDELGEALVHAQ